MVSEATIQNRLKKLLERKDFQPKYLKNLVADVCHSTSTHALMARCQVCSKGVSKQEIKKGVRYGVRFADIYNKRHQKKNGHGYINANYISKNICLKCLEEAEKILNFKIFKSFAP